MTRGVYTTLLYNPPKIASSHGFWARQDEHDGDDTGHARPGCAYIVEAMSPVAKVSSPGIAESLSKMVQALGNMAAWTRTFTELSSGPRYFLPIHHKVKISLLFSVIDSNRLSHTSFHFSHEAQERTPHESATT